MVYLDIHVLHVAGIVSSEHFPDGGHFKDDSNIHYLSTAGCSGQTQGELSIYNFWTLSIAVEESF